MDATLKNLPAVIPAITPHPYQRRLVEELKAAYRDDALPCLVLATGGGKTVIAAMLAFSSQAKNRKVWFVCHRDFLVSQTSKTFEALGVPHGILAAGYPEGMMPTMVVSIDTLRSRLHRIEERPDVMVWDECHHVAAASWTRVWEWAGAECFHMGLTATPTRLDGRGLAPAKDGAPGFTRLILGPSTGDLMDMKFLSQLPRLRAHELQRPGHRQDRRGLQQASSSRRRSTSQVIVGDIVEHYERLAPGKRMIYFCVSVEYSMRLAAAFTAAGYPAKHLDARDNTATRTRGRARLRPGQARHPLQRWAFYGGL